MIEREGPTPLGGTRSTGVFFAADGTEVDDPAIAVRGEITEYDDNDVELGRTYFDRDPRQDGGIDLTPPQHDASGNMPEEGSDFTKATWDIWHVEDGIWHRPVETRAELLRALGWAGAPEREQFENLCNLLSLPAWDAAPAKLRDEVYSWLESHRQE